MSDLLAQLEVATRSNLYKGVSSALPELSTLRVDEVYGEIPSNVAPIIMTIAITNNVPLVDSKFGKVQQGSVFETAHKVENSTKKQSACADWHQLRRLRITSTKFREVCHTRGETSAENLAKRLLRPSHPTADMRRGLDTEPAAVEEYCRAREVNHYPCGFLIHPDAAWMGSSPDGIVYDPKEQPEFGLVEIKCPNVLSYVDCPFIKISEGTHTLRKSHAYFWQIQGQLLISGLEWCDFVVYTQEGMFIQRIPRDKDITATIKEKIDFFF